MKLLLIGRHSLTEKQKLLLEKVFGKYDIIQIATVDPTDPIKSLPSSFDAIVIQALPIDLLAKLMKCNKPIYQFKIIAVDLVNSEEKAKQIAKEKDADIILHDPKTGNYRVSKTIALQRIKKIIIETEDVATI